MTEAQFNKLVVNLSNNFSRLLLAALIREGSLDNTVEVRDKYFEVSDDFFDEFANRKGEYMEDVNIADLSLEQARKEIIEILKSVAYYFLKKHFSCDSKVQNVRQTVNKIEIDGI